MEIDSWVRRVRYPEAVASHTAFSTKKRSGENGWLLLPCCPQRVCRISVPTTNIPFTFQKYIE